ncbi:hypothetical protein AQUCO_00300654v1 [Aquilegia coerulea]|uniref:MORF/ORRM1/DAG-like MORF domain-containing protein n=1 Tax=Aquilegia coerulea TaxID=218851 RepID=A0A2G5F044_AQUCA|nr:hypothetical protein AQUCO_00300654v1 [Aquilegia coerulea]
MAFLTRRTLATFITRTLSSPSSSSSSSSSLVRSRFSLAILDKQIVPESKVFQTTQLRTFGSGYSPLNDPSPNWSNRPPKETILLDGCDYEHWLVVMEFPQNLSEDEMVSSYVNTLASVVGSVEEAKQKIYSVCTSTYTGFGALISEELSYKLKGLPGVLWVLPDSYLDVPNKDYGGDLFVDGKVIPRPQYRIDQRQQNRGNRPRPRYDRRRETMQTEKREPMQRGNWAHDQRGPVSPPTAVTGQNSFNGEGQNSFNSGPRESYPNHGDYQRGGA